LPKIGRDTQGNFFGSPIKMGKFKSPGFAPIKYKETLPLFLRKPFPKAKVKERFKGG